MAGSKVSGATGVGVGVVEGAAGVAAGLDSVADGLGDGVGSAAAVPGVRIRASAAKSTTNGACQRELLIGPPSPSSVLHRLSAQGSRNPVGKAKNLLSVACRHYGVGVHTTDAPDSLTAAQQERYRRNIDVVGLGEAGQLRLLRATVLVVGAGGLGSPVITYLAAAGVGRLVIADGDVVETANLQRQVIHSGDLVGVNKAVSAAARVAELNPDVEVQVVPQMVTADSLAQLVPTVDLTVDCCDTYAAKFMVSDSCAAAGAPLVWGTAVGMQGQVSVFGVATDEGRAVWLRDLFPAEPEPGSYPLATEIGVLGAMVSQVGSVMATEAIKFLAGFGRPLAGRLLLLDAAAGRWDLLPVRPGAR